MLVVTEVTEGIVVTELTEVNVSNDHQTTLTKLCREQDSDIMQLCDNNGNIQNLDSAFEYKTW